MLRLEGYWFPLRSVCIFGRPVCQDGLCPVTHWWRLLLEHRPQALQGLKGIVPPLCGKGQRVEGTGMLKQICRCCSPSSLHALTLEAAAQLKSGRGMVWICKTKKMWIPMYLFVIASLFPQTTMNHFVLGNVPVWSSQCCCMFSWMVRAFLPSAAVLSLFCSDVIDCPSDSEWPYD